MRNKKPDQPKHQQREKEYDDGDPFTSPQGLSQRTLR